jgi:hypothetical protein
MKEIVIDGPYFEDFHVGQFLEQAPAVTLTEGPCNCAPDVMW